MGNTLCIGLRTTYLDPGKRNEPSTRYDTTDTIILTGMSCSHQTGIGIKSGLEGSGGIGYRHLIYIIRISSYLIRECP